MKRILTAMAIMVFLTIKLQAGPNAVHAGVDRSTQLAEMIQLPNALKQDLSGKEELTVSFEIAEDSTIQVENISGENKQLSSFVATQLNGQNAEFLNAAPGKKYKIDIRFRVI